MAKLKLWSAVPGDNNATPPLGWPEGMAPSNVNNTARQDRASVREWYEDAEWIDYGHTIFSVVGQVITFTGILTSVYAVGRTIRQNLTDIGLITAVTTPGGNTAVTVSGFTPAAVPTSIEAGITYNSVARLVSGTSKIEALTSSGAIAISTAGSERMRVDSSGNVGIGVAPTTKLHVFETASAGANVNALRLNVSDGTAATSVGITMSAAGDLSRAVELRAITNGTVAGTGHAFAILTAPNGGSPTERMRIDSAGFVGVGITTPTALGSGGSPHVLQVHSTGTGLTSFGYLALSSAATGNNSIMGAIAFGSTGLSGADKRTAQIISQKNDALTVNPIGNLQFQTANGGTPATRLNIAGNGDITPGADGTQQLGGTGSEWASVGTLGVQRASAGALTLNSSNAAGTIDIRTAGASRANIAANGRVMIGGGGAASGLLDVRQDSGDGPQIFLTNRVVNGANHKIGSLIFSPFRDIADPVYGAAVWAEGPAGAGHTTDLVFGTSQNNPASTYPAERMRIAALGGVTIAQPTSGYGLTVNGSTPAGSFPGNFVSNNTSTTQNSGTVIRISSSASGADAHIAFTDNTAWNAYIGVAGVTTAAEMYFAIDGDSNPQKRFAIGAGGNVDVIAGALNTPQGADVASAATVNLDTATGNVVNITGSVTITAITLTNGRTRMVRFTGAPLLTHGASLVILPGLANYQIAAGDMAEITALNGVKYVNLMPTALTAAPGDVVGYLSASTTTPTSTAAVIPGDNTIPQNTEGLELTALALTYTPKFATSLLEIEVSASFSTSVAGSAVLAFFRDSGANAIYTTIASAPNSDFVFSPVARVVVSAGSTAATTFKFRFGPTTGTAFFLRTNGSAALFGGTWAAYATIREIKQ